MSFLNDALKVAAGAFLPVLANIGRSFIRSKFGAMGAELEAISEAALVAVWEMEHAVPGSGQGSAKKEAALVKIHAQLDDPANPLHQPDWLTREAVDSLISDFIDAGAAELKKLLSGSTPS